MTENTQKKLSRRDALKALGAALGGTALAALPPAWSKPALAASELPQHGETSPVETEEPAPTEEPAAEVTQIVMFSAGTYDGNLGGRAGADALCAANAPASLGSEYTHFRAFISVNAGDEIRDMPGNYGVPTDVPIVGPTGTLIANNWADLLDGTISNSLQAAGVTNGLWLSGAAGAEGSVDSGYTCAGWTSATGSAMVGTEVETGASWMSIAVTSCSLNYDLIGIAF